MGVNNESNTEHARHGYEVHVCNLAEAVLVMINQCMLADLFR